MCALYFAQYLHTRLNECAHMPTKAGTCLVKVPRRPRCCKYRCSGAGLWGFPVPDSPKCWRPICNKTGSNDNSSSSSIHARRLLDQSQAAAPRFIPSSSPLVTIIFALDLGVSRAASLDAQYVLHRGASKQPGRCVSTRVCASLSTPARTVRPPINNAHPHPPPFPPRSPDVCTLPSPLTRPSSTPRPTDSDSERPRPIT